MILRGLVVLLVCLNLGVGAWWLAQPVPAPDPPPPIDAGVGSSSMAMNMASPAHRPMRCAFMPSPVPCPTGQPFLDDRLVWAPAFAGVTMKINIIPPCQSVKSVGHSPLHRDGRSGGS